MEVKKGKHLYNQGVDAVFKHFGDKAKLEQRFTHLGARNIQLTTCRLTATTLDIAMTREVPIDAPALLKKFIGEWNHVTQEEHWTGTPGKGYEGSISISFKGVPVTMTGKLVLTGDANSCTNDVTLNFESGIPLIGGKLAAFVAETAAEEMQKEYEFIKTHL